MSLHSHRQNPKPDPERGAANDGKPYAPPVHCTTVLHCRSPLHHRGFPNRRCLAQICTDEPAKASGSSTAPAPASNDGIRTSSLSLSSFSGTLVYSNIERSTPPDLLLVDPNSLTMVSDAYLVSISRRSGERKAKSPRSRGRR